jgi:drug/metabolite transporter (DMT)-like permease
MIESVDQRPPSLRAAIILLLLIGASGLGVGLTITAAMTNAGTPLTGVGIGAGIAFYGALAGLAGVGLIWRHRWSWWLGVATIVAGELVLVWLIVLVGADGVFALGVAIWGVALGCLLLPATRASIRRGPGR